MRRLALSLLLLALPASSACSDRFQHWVTIVVPAEIESIPQGAHHVALFSYDPLLADDGARLVDEVVLGFSHRSGRATTVRVAVSADVPRRERQYVAVVSCANSIEGWYMLLFDGLPGPSLPDRITMQRTLAPAPCVDLWPAAPGFLPYIPKQ